MSSTRQEAASKTRYSLCYHCGEPSGTNPVFIGEKTFCCEGCKSVFELLNEHGLCRFYSLEQDGKPSKAEPHSSEKFTYLDQPEIAARLISFSNQELTHVRFNIPQMHCSSCLWLLEHLPDLNRHILSSRVNFTEKTVHIAFRTGPLRISELVTLLSRIGYEPYLSLEDLGKKPPVTRSSEIMKLAVAGFVFFNVMLLSLPDYLGHDKGESELGRWFAWISFGLSIPALVYAASDFFVSSWKSLSRGFLNIDLPIALALLTTFLRSAYEVLSDTGSGYFDSMSGIIFFMLAGRILQNRTQHGFRFDRNYAAYFQIAARVFRDSRWQEVPVHEIKANERIRIHSEDLVPADGILLSEEATLDYSFVTGESIPDYIKTRSPIYAGARNKGRTIEMLVLKPLDGSLFTELWRRADTRKGQEEQSTYIERISRMFTYAVLSLSVLAFFVHYSSDPMRAWNAATTMLIIACPCALLLASTFTNGFFLQWFERNGLYLRNNQAIKNLAETEQIVLDKTGTLTVPETFDVHYYGEPLSANDEKQIQHLCSCSTHPLSQAIAGALTSAGLHPMPDDYREVPGKGIVARIGTDSYRIGSAEWIGGIHAHHEKIKVMIEKNGTCKGYFTIHQPFRKELNTFIRSIEKFNPVILSGDQASQGEELVLLGLKQENLYFTQSPSDKARFIQHQEQSGKRVLMIGDGLNDAGALIAAHTGLSLSNNIKGFSPACDGILYGDHLRNMAAYLQMARQLKVVTLSIFIYSLFYNIAGIYFAIQGDLMPVIAAILMPVSSVSIILLSYAGTAAAGKRTKSMIKIM